MNKLAIALIAALLVTGCGPSEPPSSQAPAEAPPSSADAGDATEAPAAAPDADADKPAEVVEESTGDTAATGDTIRLATDKGTAAPGAWKFQQGTHFESFGSAQGTSSAPDKIEVAEVFWYGCPHCYNFEPFIARWKQTLPADVSFVRIPVMWSPTHEVHARIFYTVEILDPDGKLHDAVFRAMHRDGKPMTTEESIRKLFTDNGIPADKFDSTFRGFAVNGKLNQARDWTQRYRVRSVPLMVVNGRYTAPGPKVRDFDQTLAVVDELVARERVR